MTTPTERLVSRELQSLADIPVHEVHVERAHEELRARLADLPVQNDRNRWRVSVAAVTAAVILVAAALCASGLHASSDRPARRPAPAPDAAAVRAAAGFVDAFAAFDVPRARAWLAPGASTTGDLQDRDWPALDRYVQATGGRLVLQPCRVVDRTGAGTTLRCAFRYQLLRSADLGLGPYGGSYFQITTRGSRVVLAFLHLERDNGFRAQVWTPFAEWMNRTHRADAAVMYADWPDDTQPGLTAPAIRLWGQRTRDYVDHVRATCGTATEWWIFPSEWRSCVSRTFAAVQSTR